MFSSSLQSNLSLLSLKTKLNTPIIRRNSTTVRCGPRNNRGPLVKGRSLSTEAMQAVQALKRAKGDELKINEIISKNLSRLIKNDLLASLSELLRQGHCELAMKVFVEVKSDLYVKTNVSLYADIVSALSKYGMMQEIDDVISEMEFEVLMGDDRGLSRLIKGLISAGRKESVVRVYRLMKEGEWGSGVSVDEYVVRILSKGLRRLGENDVADEVDAQFGVSIDGVLEKLSSV
ncbi:protein THYLAKOID ASSEMBLY 8, chloroplastic-like [Papaver somniferum]|uniref:protein THYLAKOID ASSEMBLY 8, chloroplastic-like n=1 Tax=Papaver somniferum TaxID=3469 RepID=UPI000E6FF431|nr:protein THYLAKOID ASSEMBLY 8, chloroplastic-like [Papaver somniferum]